MNKIDRYKILVRHLISIGLATSQKDLGTKLGYNNESAFSQLINGKVVEPKNFTEKLKNLAPDINLDWLETGDGTMLISSQDNHGGGQHFHGNIIGSNPQFAGRDMEINPPCSFGTEIDKIIVTMTAQADLTKEAHELTRRAQDQVDRAQAQVDKAQSQMDRLLAIIEQKLNIN